MLNYQRVIPTIIRCSGSSQESWWLVHPHFYGLTIPGGAPINHRYIMIYHQQKLVICYGLSIQGGSPHTIILSITSSIHHQQKPVREIGVISSPQLS